MSTTQRRKEENETKELGKNIRAMPVVDAVEYAFKLPPTRSVVILGPPGIGKTETVLKYAKLEAQKLGKEFIMLNEKRSELPLDEYINLVKDIMKNPDKYYVAVLVSFGAVLPDDLLGVPNIVSIKDGDKVIGVFEESAMKGSLALLTIKGIHGVLIIDDAPNAEDNVRKSFLQAALHERVVGGTNGVKLSPYVRVIATGNLVTESELASPLQRPLVGRAWFAYVKQQDLQSWYNRMCAELGDKWYKDVYAFLKRYESYYNKPELIEENIPTGPVPRAWSALAEDLYIIRKEIPEMVKTPEGQERLLKIVSGYVGYEAATQFVAFVSKPVISVEDVIKNPKLLDTIADDMDLAFRFGVQLASKLEKAFEEKKKDKIFKYLEVLVEFMDATSEDMGVFVYEMLPREHKDYLKKITTEGLVSKNLKIRTISRKIRSMIIGIGVADVLLEASR